MFNRALDKHSKLSEDDKQPAIDGAEMFVSQQRSSGQKPARLFVCVAIAALRELQMTSANPQMRTR